jgi:hypothetical protein
MDNLNRLSLSSLSLPLFTAALIIGSDSLLPQWLLQLVAVSLSTMIILTSRSLSASVPNGFSNRLLALLPKWLL